MLNIHSKYSIKYGVKSPEEIVDWAIDAGYRRISLTDINSTTAILRFVQYAKEKDFTPVAGVDIRNDLSQCYVILAKNNRGFHELNSFLTEHLHQNKSFPQRAPYLANCIIIYPFEKTPNHLLSNEYAGVNSSNVTTLSFLNWKTPEKLVLLTPMTFFNKRDFNAHRLLRAIAKNTLLSKLSEKDQALPSHWFISRSALQIQFAQFPNLYAQTEKLIQSCSIDFKIGDDAESQNLKSYTGSAKEDRKLIEELCQEGVKKRYSVMTLTIKKRIEREIEVIEEKEYLAYFLVTWDIINYAKSRGFFHVGRGSGANSIVAYLLHITDVDPLDLDLYFERFINVYRKNPPDFDIDFSWRERDEVIQYIFRRFPNAALLCTYNTFQFKATIRELGKVFGLPKEDIDRLTEGKKLSRELDEIGELVVKYSSLISGLPSHLSIHAGGIIISEQPTTWFSATFLPPKGFPTTQFSMMEAEDVGLYKYDILSQRGLSKIEEALHIILHNTGKPAKHTITDINYFKKDEKIKKLLQTGDAMGCFYVESPAMRMLMKKLNVSNYLELVAASSIIRPGVSSSGMMKEYILRHKDPERRKKAHPVLLEIMPETYGVMVYQEDVIKVAHHFAGLSLDEADILRRGMSGKYRSREEFQGIQQQFFENCLSKGYPPALTKEIWKQIESFAGYAFSKGHSASFAVESFQSLYLKAYYPLEYMVATINNGGGYYRTEIYVHEAQRLGGTIEAPEINKSQWLTCIQKSIIFLGFQHVNGLEKNVIERLLIHRKKQGEFSSFEEFLNTVRPGLESALLLIRIGAFRSFHTPKKELLWQTHLYHKKEYHKKEVQSLFPRERKKFNFPALETSQFEQAFEELELLGFSLISPFELIADQKLHPHITAKQLSIYKGRKVRCYGYLISVKKTFTSKGEVMYFGHFYDKEGTLLDTVHFPNTLPTYRFQGIGIYMLEGIATEEFNFFSLTISKMEKCPYMEDPRYV